MKKFFPLLIILITFTGALSAQIIIDLYKNRNNISEQEKKETVVREEVFENAVLKNFNNQKIVLSKVKAPIVIINFWASWCQSCMQEFPNLVSFKNQYKDEDVRIIAINQDNTPDYRQKVYKTLKKFNINFDLVTDPSGRLGREFSVSNVPSTIIFYKGRAIDFIEGNFDFKNPEFSARIRGLMRYSSRASK